MSNKDNAKGQEKAQVAPASPFDFPLRYLNPDAARNEVLQTLAQLELDIHKLGIQSTLTGVGTDHVLQNGLTIEQAVNATRNRIAKVESAYQHILVRDAK